MLIASFWLFTLQMSYRAPAPILSQTITQSIPQTMIQYQKDIENFANAYTVAEGKLLFTDAWGNLLCFDAESGRQLWRVSVGGYGSGGPAIVVQDGKVYTGAAGGIVKTVDLNSGNLLDLEFQAIVDTSWGHKSPPTAFLVADGRVYVQQTGWRAFNAGTGELLWESFSPLRINPPGMLYPDNLWALDDNLVVASGTYPIGDSYRSGVYRINPDKGTVVWATLGYSNEEPVVYQDTVILWNYNETYPDRGQTVVSVSAASGETLWSFNVGASTYQPAVYNDLLLFGAYDGNFYALNASDGTIAWKTRVTSQNNQITMEGQNPHYPLTPVASQVLVEPQTQRAFWGFAFVQNGWGSTDQYVGTLSSIDLSTGQALWSVLFEKNVSISGSSSSKIGLALLEDAVFLTAGTDLWVFDQSTGKIIGMEHFDHYIFPLIAMYNKVFVEADLKVTVYG